MSSGTSLAVEATLPALAITPTVPPCLSNGCFLFASDLGAEEILCATEKAPNITSESAGLPAVKVT